MSSIFPALVPESTQAFFAQRAVEFSVYAKTQEDADRAWLDEFHFDYLIPIMDDFLHRVEINMDNTASLQKGKLAVKTTEVVISLQHFFDDESEEKVAKAQKQWLHDLSTARVRDKNALSAADFCASPAILKLIDDKAHKIVNAALQKNLQPAVDKSVQKRTGNLSKRIDNMNTPQDFDRPPPSRRIDLTAEQDERPTSKRSKKRAKRNGADPMEGEAVIGPGTVREFMAFWKEEHETELPDKPVQCPFERLLRKQVCSRPAECHTRNGVHHGAAKEGELLAHKQVKTIIYKWLKTHNGMPGAFATTVPKYKPNER